MSFDRPLVFDACALINLHAAGRLGDILRSVGQPTLVTETVRSLELRQTEALDVLNPEGDRLEDLVGSGQLAIVDFEDDAEASLFLDFAAAIGDDGEAASLAIAVTRQFAVATDDKRARQFGTQKTPSVPLVYSLEVIKRWVTLDRVPPPDVQEALMRVKDHGRYVPHHSHPLHAWWASSVF